MKTSVGTVTVMFHTMPDTLSFCTDRHADELDPKKAHFETVQTPYLFPVICSVVDAVEFDCTRKHPDMLEYKTPTGFVKLHPTMPYLSALSGLNAVACIVAVWSFIIEVSPARLITDAGSDGITWNPPLICVLFNSNEQSSRNDLPSTHV